MRKTEASGKRLLEAKHINKSLSALGNVISALTSTAAGLPATAATPLHKTPLSHVPYRDSKLTRLLQDALSGNSKTLLILTVSSSTQQLAETISTLRFGERATLVRTRPVVNLVPDESQLRRELNRAREQILSLSRTVHELQSLLQREVGVDGDAPKSVAQCSCCVSGIAAPVCNSASMLLTEAQSTRTGGGTSGGELAASMEDAGDVDVDVVRCAICGLSEEDTQALARDTGETLGDLMTCDGNCGLMYHSVCAGVSDDSMEREGDWLCTVCSAEVSSATYTVRGDSSCNSSNAFTASPKDDSHLTARLLADYHSMRRERNRLLQQWQQELKLSAMLESRRIEADRARDEELIRTRQELDCVRKALESEVAKSKSAIDHYIATCAKREMQDAWTNTCPSGENEHHRTPTSSHNAVQSLDSRDGISVEPAPCLVNAQKNESVQFLGSRDELREPDYQLISARCLGSNAFIGVDGLRTTSTSECGIPRPWAGFDAVKGGGSSVRRRRREDRSSATGRALQIAVAGDAASASWPSVPTTEVAVDNYLQSRNTLLQVTSTLTAALFFYVCIFIREKKERVFPTAIYEVGRGRGWNCDDIGKYLFCTCCCFARSSFFWY